jgi:hypothetical protein
VTGPTGRRGPVFVSLARAGCVSHVPQSRPFNRSNPTKCVILCQREARVASPEENAWAPSRFPCFIAQEPCHACRARTVDCRRATNLILRHPCSFAGASPPTGWELPDLPIRASFVIVQFMCRCTFTASSCLPSIQCLFHCASLHTIAGQRAPSRAPGCPAAA